MAKQYSNGLQHLKFMQRARQKEEALKKAEEEATVKDDSHWVLPTKGAASGKQCVVIMEGDPKPGALLGRMSFQSCNTTIDKLSEEMETTNKRRFMAAKERIEGVSAAAKFTVSRDGSDHGMTEGLEQDDQNKKPKVDHMHKKPTVESRPSDATCDQKHEDAKNDQKPWQGWKGGADYRLLRPPNKR